MKWWLSVLSLVMMVFFVNNSFAQEQEKLSFKESLQSRKAVKEGDKAYNIKDFMAAKSAYAKAVKQGNMKAVVDWREGNVSYRNQEWEGALEAYQGQADNELAKSSERFAGNYNAGNVKMQGEEWDEAINSYKEALKLNPNDREAKYNLSYAMMKKQEDQQDNDDDEEDEDNEDEDNDDQDQDNEDENQEDEKDQDEQEQNQDNKPESKLTEEQAERLLQALREQEKDAMDMKEEEGTGTPTLDKDW